MARNILATVAVSKRLSAWPANYHVQPRARAQLRYAAESLTALKKPIEW